MKREQLWSDQRWPSRWLAVPVGLGQFAAAGTILVLIFTGYCQIYCVSAHHPMHGAAMPLRYSLAWAIGAVLPWLACFEICKSVRTSNAALVVRYGAAAGWFVAAAILSIVMELGLDELVSAHTRPLQMQAAAQLPSAALVAFLLLLGRPQSLCHQVEAIAAQPLRELQMIARTVEWVEAAGNYVQVHAGERTTLYRLTMTEVESALDPTAFARIHRSTIVSLAAIEARVVVKGGPGVRLRDGTLLKVGRRYAANLGVTSA